MSRWIVPPRKYNMMIKIHLLASPMTVRVVTLQLTHSMKIQKLRLWLVTWIEHLWRRNVSRESDNFKILRSRINRNLFVYVFIMALQMWGLRGQVVGGGGGSYVLDTTEWRAMFGGRGTAIMKIILGLTGQVVGGVHIMDTTEWRAMFGEGRGDHNKNYSGIDRPGCGGGFVCNGHNGVKGHVWGRRGGPQSQKLFRDW